MVEYSVLFAFVYILAPNFFKWFITTRGALIFGTLASLAVFILAIQAKKES